MRSYNTFQNASLFVLRIITAAIFYVAAWYKIPFWKSVPQGMEMSPFLLFTTKLLSIAEPLGATAILFGFLTRLAAGGLTIIMIGAIIVSQFVYHIGFAPPTGPGWDFPAAVLGGSLILIAFGAGRWSIDSWRGRK